MGKGRFIVLDGPDGAGKTTQAKLLVERFRQAGFSPEHLRDPGGTELGEQIRVLLLDPLQEMSSRTETLLFAAARAQLVHEKIRPAMEDGKIVVCERFSSSTIAYQGSAGGLGVEAVENLCLFAAGGLVPDMTILLDMDPEVSLKRIRGAKDRMELRSHEYHERVRIGFMQFALAHPGHVAVVEASGTEQEVHDKIWGSVAGVI